MSTPLEIVKLLMREGFRLYKNYKGDRPYAHLKKGKKHKWIRWEENMQELMDNQPAALIGRPPKDPFAVLSAEEAMLDLERIRNNKLMKEDESRDTSLVPDVEVLEQETRQPIIPAEVLDKKPSQPINIIVVQKPSPITQLKEMYMCKMLANMAADINEKEPKSDFYADMTKMMELMIILRLLPN